METTVIPVKHPVRPDDFRIPGQALAEGAIVAFPTETVYGLGASAFLPEAVAEIFRLKGRPVDNPLIVHLLSADWLDQVTGSIPDLFWPLYRAFSPGPLTFVMPRHPSMPDIVTSGLSTVAVRFPSQPAARALLEIARVPVVAPSANLSGKPSPTRARHVLDDFAGRIPFLIDDGPCEVGVESTVLDLTADPPRILRPGKITAGCIRDRTGIKVTSGEASPQGDDLTEPLSPGMKYRHYAPSARVAIALPEKGQSIEDAFLEILDTVEKPAGLFLSDASWEALREKLPETKAYTYEGKRDLASAMHSLFDALRTLDEQGAKWIVAEGFSGEDASAYMDRLTKAATGHGDDRRILFVCEGNTCRSPMAEAIFNDHFPERGVRASSAGLAAIAGQTMQDLAIEALAEWGIEAEARPSRQIRAKLVQDADLIITMTERQRATLKYYYPDAKARLLAMADFLDGRDLGDPFGQPLHAYRRVRDELGSAMQKLFDQLILI